jgi:hypothetical protein
MTAKIIQFIPKPNPNRKTLEQQAAELAEQFTKMAGAEVAYEMDSAPSEYVAPSDDCA